MRGSVGPKSATTGVPTSPVRCITEVSFETTKVAASSSAVSSGIVRRSHAEIARSRARIAAIAPATSSASSTP